MRGNGERGAVDGRGVSQVHTSPHIQEGMFGLLICHSGVTEQTLQSTLSHSRTTHAVVPQCTITLSYYIYRNLTQVHLSQIWSALPQLFKQGSRRVKSSQHQFCGDATHATLSHGFPHLPPLTFYVLSPHSFTSLGAVQSINHCRWHTSWVSSAWHSALNSHRGHYIKERMKRDEDKRGRLRHTSVGANLAAEAAWLIPLHPHCQQPHVRTKIPLTLAMPNTTAKCCRVLLLVIILLTCSSSRISGNFFLFLGISYLHSASASFSWEFEATMRPSLILTVLPNELVQKIVVTTNTDRGSNTTALLCSR